MPETETRVARRFDVWNEVPLVPQLTGMSCWAAAAAMIIGWRDSIFVDPQKVATGSGTWEAYRAGLHPADVDALARAWGLTQERRDSWTGEALRRVLARYGPVWLGEASPGLHSIVVAGMHGDGTPDGTWVRINDPWPVGRGERYTLPWRTLAANFRAASDLIGVQAHVLHAGGRRGSSRSRVRESRDGRPRVSLPPFTDTPREDVMIHNGNGRRAHHHEEYESVFGSPSAVALGVIAAGERYVNTATAGASDPLRGHGGTGENLYLVWNEVPDACAEIDVVVHLHGYQSMEPDAALTRRKAEKSGLRLGGRARPTLGIVPRGRKITSQEYQTRLNAYNHAPQGKSRPRPDAYTFPALLAGSGAGLEALIAYSLAWFAREVLRRPSGAPRTSRLILTAHSGGGSPLNELLGWRSSRAACNPHEVHVFDALYGSGANAEGWALARIAADRALGAGDLRARGGGLRILYGRGTRTASEMVGRSLPRAGDALRDAYRAEATTVGHDEIPGTFGPTLLQDVRASVRLAPAAHGHALDDDAYPAEEAEPASAGQGAGYAGVHGGYGYVEALAVDDDVRAWLAAAPAARAPLASAVASWIADTGRSGIELISDAARRSHFLSGVDWSRTDFPGNDQNRSVEPTALFDALAARVPERRVTSIRYHDVDSVVQAVPDETRFRLYPDAKDAYVAMRAAARADGVTLRIGSAWRSLATQQGLAAKNPNASAVAQRVSAHCYGLAIDLLLSVPGLSVREITTRPMSNIVAMYRSPVYKWMALHGREHGWFPYRREPWHWEYNPAGFPARFEATGRSATGHAYGAPLGLFERYPSAAALEDPGVSPGVVPLVREDGAFALQAAAVPASGPTADWPRVSADDRILYVMECLVNQHAFPVNGAAGLVGNLWAESGVLPSRIEGSAAATPMRAPAFAGGTRDFTADEVMNRSPAAQQGPRLPGIGLAQWTSSARRAGLFRHGYQSRALGSAILFNMDAQLDYLVSELRNGYAAVHRLVTQANVTVNDSADEVVYRFEVPGSLLENGALLPRTHPRVQAVFTTRRGHAARALRVYRAAHPVAGAAPLQAAPGINWCMLGQTIAGVALRELADWMRNGAPIPENDPGRLPALQRYWGAVPGANAAVAAAASARNDRNFPWSAAFICYVMSQAGVRRTHGFEFAGAHIHYIVGALRNRERSDTSRPFWLLDSLEIVNETTVQPGDLLCMNREVDGRLTTHSYSNLRRAFWQDGTHDRQNVRPSGSSHCTLVVRIVENAGGRFAETVGGNENGSVTLNRYGRIPLNASGGIANPAAHRIFGMIKNTGCQS